MPIPLRGTSLGSPEEVYRRAMDLGALRPDYLMPYLEGLYEDCAYLGLRADVLVAQADVETAYDYDGDGFWEPFASDRWMEGNPAGIGIVDNMPPSQPGYRFQPREAARIHATHMAGYVGITPPAEWIAMDFRWGDMMRAGYFGVVSTTADLGNGRWASNKNYGALIEERHKRYFDRSQEVQPMSKPYILLVAGHRSYGDGGNPVERDLTDDMALAYERAFKGAGFEVHWFQRDLDGDSDPTMTYGGLDAVAKGCGRVLANRAKSHPNQMAIMLDLHYNGAHSPFHVIVPDNVGLSTAYPEGRNAYDTAANNTLDVKLAEAIAKHAVAATGLGMYRGRLGRPGVMSERETGVALSYNARLAMFAATAPSRMTAVRLVVEHGGTSDAPARKYDLFAQAALKAVMEVFDLQAEQPKPDPKPSEPKPEPTLPRDMTVAIASAMFGEATGDDGRVYGFDPNGPVSKAWLKRGEESGRFPELVKVFHARDAKGQGRKYFVFSDGFVDVREASIDVDKVIEAIRNVIG